jgi:hypothetical protein
VQPRVIHFSPVRIESTGAATAGIDGENPGAIYVGFSIANFHPAKYESACQCITA